ncbi:MAG: hypothetical protein IKS16_01680 [Lachnospiraceae bacterium]|nr:hypothetical protein [Lachnospiraceae bacterium]
MANIIRATTPTFKYTLKTVKPSDLTKAYLTIKQNGETLMEKTLSEAVVGENYLAWTFTQAETLQMSSSKIMAQLNWKTADGTRGASRKALMAIDCNFKEEVI